MTEHASAPAPRRAPPAAYVMMLATGCFYGLQISLTKVATTGGVPPVALIFWTVLGSGLILLGLTAIRGRIPKLDGPHLLSYVLMGIVGVGGPNILLAYVAPRIPAGIVAMTLTLVPMLVYGLALLLRMEGFRWLRFSGLILGFSGMLLMVAPTASLPEPEMVGWLLVALAAPFCFAVFVISGERWRPPETDSLALAAGGIMTAAIFCLVVTAATGQWWFGSAPFDWADASILFIMAIQVATYVMFFECIRISNSVFYSTVAYPETLFGVAWGYIIFSEAHSAWVWAALVLLLGGIYLVNRSSKAGVEPGS